MKKIAVFFLSFLFFGLNSCNWFPPSPNVPFFCKVNGKNFRPDKDNSPIGGIGSNPLSITYDKTNGWFYIIVRNSPNSISLILKIPQNEELSTKSYQLVNDIKLSKAFYTINYAEFNKEQLISTFGNVTITKVQNNKICGTFDFVARSQKSNEDFKITKGQFNNLSYY